MTEQKEIGYEVGNVMWRNLPGHEKLWRKTDFNTKEYIVNKQGEIAINLSTPVVIDKFLSFLKKESINSNLTLFEIKKLENKFKKKSLIK